MSRRLLGGGVVVGLVLALGAYGAQSMAKVRQLKQEVGALEKNVADLRQQTEKLAATVERLRTDPLYIEKLAREELGLVREGETVLKFPSSGR